MELLPLLLLRAFLAFLALMLAQRKHRSIPGWTLATLLFGLIPLVVLLIVRKGDPDEHQ